MSQQAQRKTTGRPNHSHTEMTALVNRHRCSMLISATISLGLFCVFQRCCLGLTIRFIKGPLCIHMKNGIYCCGVSCGNQFVIFLALKYITFTHQTSEDNFWNCTHMHRCRNLQKSFRFLRKLHCKI